MTSPVPGTGKGAGSTTPAGELELRREVVRELRQVLVTVLGDEDEILEPDAAVALAVQAGLDRDDVAGDERLVTEQPEVRRLVHLEAHAVPEAVEEPLVERLAGLLRPLGLLARLLEDVARDLEELETRDARLDRIDRAVDGLLDEAMPLDDLLVRLADHECPRHVR